MALFAILMVVVGTMRFGLVLRGRRLRSISAVTAYGFAFGIGAFGQLDELHGPGHRSGRSSAALNFV